MLMAPLPDNEAQRLDELRSYRLLDSGGSECFDDISQLVRDITGAPIGIISLVDENRQWFKSCLGLDACETPRNISFCSHTILQRSPLIIEDARLDERFSDNPLVVEPPHIRFYAGFPLISRNGLALGSLCAVDHQPRQLSSQQISALQRLAKLVLHQMEAWRDQQVQIEAEQQQIARSVPPHPGAGQDAQPMVVSKQQILSMADLIISQQEECCFSLLRLQARELNRLAAALGDGIAQSLRIALEQRLLQNLPEEASCGQLNEQEWLILLPFTRDQSRLTQLAHNLTQTLPQPIVVADQLLSSPVAIGIAVYRNNYSSAESLMADATIALQQANRLRGSAFRFIDLSTRLEAQDNLRLELELRDGLIRGQLESHFQPLVNLQNGTVVGVEALARWRGLNGELVSPNLFIPAAQRAELLADLDLLMIHQSIQASHSLAAAWPDHPMVLSLNLSASLLESDSHMETLFSILDQQNLPSQWQLQLEVLEGAMQMPTDELRHRLEAISQRGVLLAIDDFGTGYSSLNRLNSFPFHSLKVDMSFVHRLQDPTQPSDRILDVIQAMATTLGLHTTTEGVENDSQRQWLKEHGFNWGQGYLFAQPMPLAEAISFIESNRQAVQDPAPSSQSGTST